MILIIDKYLFYLLRYNITNKSQIATVKISKYVWKYWNTIITWLHCLSECLLCFLFNNDIRDQSADLTLYKKLVYRVLFRPLSSLKCFPLDYLFVYWRADFFSTIFISVLPKFHKSSISQYNDSLFDERFVLKMLKDFERYIFGKKVN